MCCDNDDDDNDDNDDDIGLGLDDNPLERIIDSLCRLPHLQPNPQRTHSSLIDQILLNLVPTAEHRRETRLCCVCCRSF